MESAMNKILFVLSFVALALVSGCNTSPDGPLYGSDAGVTPVGDSGPTVLADAATTPPTPWRHCGADGMSPTRFRVTVLDAANGPLGSCASGWDPTAYSLPVTGTVYTPGSDIDQRVRPEWVGAEVDLGFRCSSGDYAAIPAGSTAMSRNVRIEVWYDPDATGAPEDVSSIVTTAVSPGGGYVLRLPLCSSLL
jgi:hypothetical protein